MSGILYLIPTILSDTPLNKVLPEKNSDIIRSLQHFIVENTRTARRFLKQVDKSINIDSLTFYELNQHTDPKQVESFISPLAKGFDVGIISEAGCPGVADPGADAVAIAQQKGYKVIPLVGPSSILLSLMASGFNGQSFAFQGYLPINKSERISKIKSLENRVYTESQTQIFIETPYRNLQLLEELCKTLRPQTKLCLAADITSEKQVIRTLSIAKWRTSQIPDIHKHPCIFLIYK